MGDTYFYGWLNERYPTITTQVSGSLPPVDHFYIDMNALIHDCAHPGDQSWSPPSEESICREVCRRVEELFYLVKPLKVLMLAVDGVPPVSKMQEKRDRRFKSAKKRGASSTASFDSNCISPGTAFMEALCEALNCFIRGRVSGNSQFRKRSAWGSIEVIVSGADVPGEGEHKIMENIRNQKAMGALPSDIRHCIYGSDADLIMLALVTHQPNFLVLRERRWDPSLDYDLLSVRKLRRQLQLEFSSALGEFFDLERCIDDFVFMCFLVGNDFCRSIPTLSIREDAILTIIKLHKLLIPRLQSYLTDSESVNWGVFQVFISKIGALEGDIVEFRRRLGEDRRSGRCAINATRKFEFSSSSLVARSGRASSVPIWTEANIQDELSADFRRSCSSQVVAQKQYYYARDDHNLADMTKNFVEALTWSLAYYHHGCIAWRWFNSYVYCPYASDLVGLKHVASTIEFRKEEPLSPFQQLLCLLPPENASYLPRPYQELMTKRNSPMKHLFPEYWNSVSDLPSIDPELLVMKTSQISSLSLRPEEQKRNMEGEDCVYRES